MKYLYDTQAEIPEALRAFYTETDGKWILDCEGAAPASKVDEFRKNNIDLKKQLEAFAGVDPKRFAELVKKESDFEAGKADTKEKIDELVSKRVATMTAEHEATLLKVNEESATMKRQLTTLQVDQAVIQTAAEIGLRKSATEDVVARASRTWRLSEDGKPTAYNEDGEKLFGRSGEPMSMKEWTEGLAKSAPHLFEESSGSGSNGGGGGGGGDEGANPWSEKSWNLTKQGQMLTTDPNKAKRLAAAAGKTIGLSR